MHMHKRDKERRDAGIQEEHVNQEKKYVKPTMEKIIIPEPEKKEFDSGCTCCTCGCS
ncbi:MAG: hypothetical protein KAS99_01240 [Candidatus Omnitrophica bacterium]|nr:hypothetical protein [Candidatus Omnitrophota bacterium]